MDNAPKIKPRQAGMIIFTSILLLILGGAALFGGEDGFDWAFCFIQALMASIHFIVLFRTRNSIYLISISLEIFWILTLLPLLKDHPLHVMFAIGATVLLAAHIWVLFSKKINWRYREILELAAKPVKTAANGFTSRPFPTGPAEYSREEALEFARFLKKHVIVFPFIESDRVVLVIPRIMWTYMLFFKRNYDNASYVALTNTGQVTVRIAKLDYLSYREELTFDQLCSSLGELFKQFLQWYREGNPEKIVKHLNTGLKKVVE